MSMPAQKPGRSKQDYGTPWELIRAVEKRFDKLAVDLAANEDGSNAKAPRWLWNAFGVDWHALAPGEWLWLNPPFADIRPWAEKCKFEATKGARIIMLTPASIGAEWFADHVEGGHSLIVGLRPRIAFEGGGHQKSCNDPQCLGCQTYPKDCMLTVWGLNVAPVTPFCTWRWK